ncbi:putative phosphoglycerate mutase [Dothidotthia symphoricarpi CBS 119687]|uniref:Putative phosphoglycerate mutase n=1 Tax=Dothidotthia symphoricarpi CBS 119687 TaxID=1392245 RepID=A0A6A6A4F1_9PLEO|nr:putative phosphoglycerate mutase [Dothidotthia symphoricarpi CBS 119687]KAF2125638.1 putative phosphoglycerate mutase [Dothidotthia symphoricarpi CBS 119687]
MSDQEALTPRVIIVRHGLLYLANFVGPGNILDPCSLVHVFVSPRVRAVQTFELLLPASCGVVTEVTYTDELTEWNYGNYEGLKDQEIRVSRKNSGLDKHSEWDIWSDGCEGGESKQQVTGRLDRLISQIKEIQKPYMRGEKPADVLLVAHGLILRCFLKRWLGCSINDPLEMILAPGAIAVLSYKKNDVNKPAFHVGVALPSRK